MHLSRGAKRCLELLQWYSSRFKEVYPFQSTLAKHLNRSLRQTAYYLQELKIAGLVDIVQCGPGPASYIFSKAVDKSFENHRHAEQNCIAIAELLHSFQRPSINEFKTSSSSPSASHDMIQAVENYFEGYELDGRMADSGLIRRVAGLLGDKQGLDAYKPHVKAWRLRSGLPYSWGIFIRLAEDVAAWRGKPVASESESRGLALGVR